MKRKHYSAGMRGSFEYGFSVPARSMSGSTRGWDDVQPLNNIYYDLAPDCIDIPQQPYYVVQDDRECVEDLNNDFYYPDDQDTFYPYDNVRVVNDSVGASPKPSHVGTDEDVTVDTADKVTHLPTSYVNGGPATTNRPSTKPADNAAEIQASGVSTPTLPIYNGQPPADETPSFRNIHRPYEHLKHGSHQYDVTPQRMQEQGMKVVINQHGQEFSHDRIQAARELVERTINVYESDFGRLVARDIPREINIHMFDTVRDFVSSVNVANYTITRYTGGYIEPTKGTMWISPSNFSRSEEFGSLPHELGHLLFQCATGGFFNYADSKVQSEIEALDDGFCEYISDKVYNKGAHEFSRVAGRAIKYFQQNQGYDGQVLAGIGESLGSGQCSPVSCNTVQYKGGQALVQFLMEKAPGTLQNVFTQAAKLSTSVRYGSSWEATRNANAILQEINKHSMGEVADWLQTYVSPSQVRQPYYGVPTDYAYSGIDQYHYDPYTRSSTNIYREGGRPIEVKTIVVPGDGFTGNNTTRVASTPKPAVSRAEVPSSKGAETPDNTVKKPTKSTQQVVATSVTETGKINSASVQNVETQSPVANKPVVNTPQVVDVSRTEVSSVKVAPVNSAETSSTVASKSATKTPQAGAASEPASNNSADTTAVQNVETQKVATAVPTPERSGHIENVPKTAAPAVSIASSVKVPQSHSAETQSHSVETQRSAVGKPAVATHVPDHSVSVESHNSGAVKDVYVGRGGETQHVSRVEAEIEKVEFAVPSPNSALVKTGIKYDVTPQAMSKYGMKVILYKQGNPLSHDSLESARGDLEKVMHVYEEHFGKFIPRAIPQEVSILLFDDHGKYARAVQTVVQHNATGSGLTIANDGLVFVSSLGLMPNGQQHFSVMLHEFCHVLYRSATGGFLDHNNNSHAYYQSKVLTEGFSNFIPAEAQKDNYSHVATSANSYLQEKNQNAPVLSQMGSDIQYKTCGSKGCNTVKYEAGQVLIKYLEEASPGLLKNVFKEAAAAASSARHSKARTEYDAAKFLQPINKFSVSDLSSWTGKLAPHSASVAVPVHDYRDTPYYQDQSYSSDTQWGTYDSFPQRGRGRRVKHDAAEDQDLSMENMQVSAAVAQSQSEVSQVAEQKASPAADKAIASSVPKAASGSDEKTERVSVDVSVSDVSNPVNTAGEMASVVPEAVSTANVAVKAGTPSETPSDAVSDSYARKGYADIEAQFTASADVDSKLLDRCNIKLVVHSTTQLSDKAAARIKKTIVKTLKAYQQEFGELPQSDTARKVDIFLFNNSNDLKDALKDIGEPNWDTAGGINWSSLGKIYVYKLGKIKVENLAHEMTHQLMHYSTGHAFDKTPGMAILCEGVADYIQYLVKHNKKGTTIEFSSVIDSVRKIFSENPELRNAKSLEEIYGVIEKNSDNPDYSGLKYSFGQTFVQYLQKVYPDALKALFAAGHEKSAKGESFDKLASIANDIPSSFGEWLSENTLEKHISKHEMLTVSEADNLGFRDTIANSAVVRGNVYSANLEDSNHGHVGKLSPVAHFVHNGAIRAYNPFSGDGVLLGKEFSYMKLVSTADGPRYAYCDVEGREFTTELSEATVDQIAKILAKYDPNFSVIREAVTNLGKTFTDFGDERDTAARDKVIAAIDAVKSILSGVTRNMQGEALQYFMDTDLVQRDPSMSNITDAVRHLRIAYSHFVSHETKTLLHSPESSTFEQAVMLSRVLKSIVYIDPEAIVGTNDVTFDQVAKQHHDKILRVVGLGKGDLSGASILLDNQKLGELPSNAEGFVKHTDAAGKEVATFVTMDALKAVHTSYSGTPLIIVTTDAQGNKVANFWRGTKSGTLSDKEIEAEVNQFSDLSAKGIKARESFPLSKDIKIAIYDKEPVFDDETPVIVQGAKLDDRGTARDSDDLYSAKLKVGDHTLIQKMSSLQFYMTEERTDESGNKIERSDLLIRDVASDRVIQFPESITHLKLIRTEKGTVRLVPCTKDGDTNPQGMPENMEQYSYIDPIFVYDRKSSEWVASNSKFSLADFSGYSSGTLFKLSQDLNDPAIKRDADGNVLRVNDQPYIVSVTLDGPNGERVGRLASATAFFQDKVFLSMDHSYSQSDFVSSKYWQEAEVLDTSVEDVKRVALSGKNDLGTDRGFSEYYSQYQRTQEDDHNLRTEIRELASGTQPEAITSSEVTQVADGAARRQSRSTKTHEASESESSTVTSTSLYMVEESNSSAAAPRWFLNIFDHSTGTYMQFPNTITHVKVATHAGQKYLVPCTADGNESPEGMPNQGKVYISPLWVHSAASKFSTESGDKAQLSLLDLASYADNTLFSIKAGGKLSYSSLGHEDKVGDPIRVPHLYDENGAEVAMLSTYGPRIRDSITIKENSDPSIPDASEVVLSRGSRAAEGHNVEDAGSTVDTTHFAAENAKSNASDNISHGYNVPSIGANRGYHVSDAQHHNTSVYDVHHSNKEHDPHDSGYAGHSEHQYGYSDSGFAIL